MEKTDKVSELYIKEAEEDSEVEIMRLNAQDNPSEIIDIVDRICEKYGIPFKDCNDIKERMLEKFI